MKIFKLWTIIIGLTLIGCNQFKQRSSQTKTQTKRLMSDSKDKDKEEIKKLIREVLNWADSKTYIDLLPMITDSKDSIYLEFDLKKHKLNLLKFKEANLFSIEFLDNYDRIILTLNKRLKNNDYEQWLVGYLPTFNFSADANPWCLCQDVPFDKPNPWDLIEIETISLEDGKGEFNWKWGKLEQNTDSEWKKFEYRFRVVKENSTWKISYLQGFDFNASIRKD